MSIDVGLAIVIYIALLHKILLSEYSNILPLLALFSYYVASLIGLGLGLGLG